MGLLDRLGFPTGQTAKIIDGQHPVHTPASGNMPKPDMLPLPDGEDGRGIYCRRNVLVALSGTDLDTQLVTVACTLAKAKKSSVFAIYGIEVPRKLAIDAEMPTETQIATAALERAASVAEQLHVRLDPEIIQSRHYGQSMVDEANAHECALLILGLPYHIGVGGHFDLGETADFVLKNAPCKVWLVRGERAEVAESAERREAIGASR